MYRIAICDDDSKELNKAEQQLEEYKMIYEERNLTVSRFTAIEPLLMEIENGNCFDLLLLDIYLPGLNGIEGYRKLQQKGIEYPVIFLTTSLDHAVSAFQVNAVQYLVKPVEQREFFSALDKAFLNIEMERGRHIILKINNGLRRINLRDILYCEAQNNHQVFHFTDSTKLSVKMTMTGLCEMVSEFPDFVRVGSAYMVNLSHVDSLNAKEIHLDSGDIIWIPRGSYSTLKERYFAFFCDGGEREC